MKKMTHKKWGVLLLGILCIFCLTACQKDFDAATYVQTLMDCQFKGDTKPYAEFAGISEEDAQTLYEEQGMGYLGEAFADTEILELFGDNEDRYLDVIKKLFETSKYEVKSAQKDDDGNYTVSVDVTPTLAMQDWFSAIQDYMTHPTSTDQDGIVNDMLQLLEDCVANPTYGDTKTIEIKVVKDEDGAYTISDENLELFVQTLVSQPESDDIWANMNQQFESEYLNWTKAEWDAASDADKDYCCLEVSKFLYADQMGDVDLNTIDTSDATVREGIDSMRSSINTMFDSGYTGNIGSYFAAYLGVSE